LYFSNKFTTYLFTIAVYKMHDPYCIKIIDARQAKMINNYKNVKTDNW